jgi:16S rRNA processing protein RimM
MGAEAEWLLFGTVAKTHGLKGELVLRPLYPDFKLQKKVKSLQMELGGSRVPFFIGHISGNPGSPQILLEDLNSMKEALTWVGAKVWIRQEDLPVKKGKIPYYYSIQGYEVIDKHLGLLGKVTGVEENPAHDLLVISKDGSELLVPIIDQFVKAFHVNEAQIQIDLPEGYIQAFTLDSTPDDAD